MRSGADVEAFQAALNRDIGGDVSTSQPSESEAVIMSQLDKDGAMEIKTTYGKLRKNGIPKEGFVRSMRGIVGDQMLKKAVTTLHGQKMSNQQAMITEQANVMASRSKQVPFALLMPIVVPQLDKDRAMQLTTIYVKLRKNEIPKEEFVRLMRDIIGDQMLKKAVTTLHGQPEGSSEADGNGEKYDGRLKSLEIAVREELEAYMTSQAEEVAAMERAIKRAFDQYLRGRNIRDFGSQDPRPPKMRQRGAIASFSTPSEVLTQLQQENAALKSQVEVLTAQQEEARVREEALRKRQEETDAMMRFMYNQMRSANPNMPPFHSPNGL